MREVADFGAFKSRRKTEAARAADVPAPAEDVAINSPEPPQTRQELIEHYPNVLRLLDILLVHRATLEATIVSKALYYQQVAEFQKMSKTEFLDFLELFPEATTLQYVKTKPAYCLAILHEVLRRTGNS